MLSLSKQTNKIMKSVLENGVVIDWDEGTVESTGEMGESSMYGLGSDGKEYTVGCIADWDGVEEIYEESIEEL